MWATRFDIKHFCAIQRFIFGAMGIDVTSLECTFKHPFFFGYLSLVFVTFFSATIHHYFATEYDDVNALTFDLLPFFQCLTATTKIATFVYKHKEFVKIIKRIHLMTEQASREERQIIDVANKTDKIFCGCYYVTLVAFLITVCFVPPIFSLVVYLKYGYLQSFSPSNHSNPLDESRPIYFILTATLMTFNLYFGIHCTSSMDTLFLWLVHNIAAQFHVLECKLRNAASEIDREKMKAAILASIEHHQNVITLADSFNDIYKIIIFVEFALNNMQLCLLAYQITNGIAVENLLYIITFLVVVIFQLLLYCYGGQRIQEESIIISTRIYEIFPWERLAIHNRKMLLLSMLRAQKSCEISGYFFVADWELFEWVLKTTYSMVALLSSVDSDNDV